MQKDCTNSRAWNKGVPGVLQLLPQIPAGSPKMCWFLYTTPLSGFWKCNWATWKKKLNFEPWTVLGLINYNGFLLLTLQLLFIYFIFWVIKSTCSDAKVDQAAYLGTNTCRPVTCSALVQEYHSDWPLPVTWTSNSPPSQESCYWGQWVDLAPCPEYFRWPSPLNPFMLKDHLVYSVNMVHGTLEN